MSGLARDYLSLCKPRVVMLMILTSIVGMCLAPSEHLSITVLVFGNLGIACVAGAAAALNHVADLEIDKIMQRTQRRPIVQGKINTRNSILFAFILGVFGVFILLYFTNRLTAILTCLSLVGYAV